jgi:hypothetical protein
MKGSLVWLPLRHTWHNRTDRLLLQFHVTFVIMSRAPPAVAPSSVLRHNWKTLAWLTSRWSKPPDVDACPHIVFICSSVLRCKSTNLLPLGFEIQTIKPSQWFWGTNYQTVDLDFDAQTKKLSQWFWNQTTDKPLSPILRLNRKIHASRLLHMYDADRTQCHPTFRLSDNRVPDLCLIIPNPPHQFSYSCLDPHCYSSCRIHHLHITRQSNVFLHTK